jgi:hypothetical protein
VQEILACGGKVDGGTLALSQRIKGGQEPGIFLATANYTTVKRLPVSHLFNGMTSIA